MSERDPDHSLHGKISTQHRRLDGMFEDLRAALQPREDAADPAASDILRDVREEVDAHFELEERLYYPSISALRPEAKPQLSALLERHAGFLTLLDEIATTLRAGTHADAAPLFETFVTEIGLHEAAEENILHNIEQRD